MNEQEKRDIDSSAKIAKFNDVDAPFAALDFPDYGAHHAEPVSDCILRQSCILPCLSQLLDKDFVIV
jgi:hypothetical protein